MGSPARRDYEEGWNSAVQLADWLRQGGDLPQQQSSIVLGPGEELHCTVSAEIAMFTSTDVSYSSSSFIAGSSWTGLAATAGASMLWSGRQRRKAEREAAAQWRSFGLGNVAVTNHRVMYPIEGQIVSQALQGGIASFEPVWNQYLAVLQIHGSPPVGLRGPAVPYLSVLLHVLLFRHVPEMTTG